MYRNFKGVVNKVDSNRVRVGGVEMVATSERSLQRINAAMPEVGDEVEYNFNSTTMELIYLRVIKPKRGYGQNYRECSSYHSGSDDPEDSPEGYDLDAMGYHHLGME